VAELKIHTMTTQRPPTAAASGGKPDFIRSKPDGFAQELEEATAIGRREFAAMDPELSNAIGFTHFDTNSSEDNRVTVLMARDDLAQLASQMIVRIKSREDGRSYLGTVVRGPFAEPDAVPPNSTMAISVVVQGKKLQFSFDYHGRVEIEILGEELDGVLVPPRYRPRPKSPVYAIDESESARILGLKDKDGTEYDLTLGVVVGYEKTEARIPSDDKSVLPRHTGILGTTGGGKSTTVATLIHEAQKANIATIVFDVEGEYTHVDEPTEHAPMRRALEKRGKEPAGVRSLEVLYLADRETTNPDPTKSRAFSLAFSSLSPYAIGEILEMSDAQRERFHRAYDVAKLLLKDFGIFPQRNNADDAQRAMEVDELTTGWPQMSLQHVLDVVNTYLFCCQKSDSDSKKGKRKKGADDDESDDSSETSEEMRPTLYSQFAANPGLVVQRVRAAWISNEISWRAVMGKLFSLRRLGIFDHRTARPVDYDKLLAPGRVTVIDLSDTASPQLNNLVIADILRGVQERQEERYRDAIKSNRQPSPVMIIVEEAHEFLSASRISAMPVLFEQVARIAKRGRKRWLGLVFVTQLPQHLPGEVLGLLNNVIIHKITDSTVISRMQRTLGSIDESLWNRVSRLAPGQALVSFTSFTRPLMVAIDPAPCRRLLVD
jgi:DNA helicase HerA-like ATPase